MGKVQPDRRRDGLGVGFVGVGVGVGVGDGVGVAVGSGGVVGGGVVARGCGLVGLGWDGPVGADGCATTSGARICGVPTGGVGVTLLGTTAGGAPPAGAGRSSGSIPPATATYVMIAPMSTSRPIPAAATRSACGSEVACSGRWRTVPSS